MRAINAGSLLAISPATVSAVFRSKCSCVDLFRLFLYFQPSMSRSCSRWSTCSADVKYCPFGNLINNSAARARSLLCCFSTTPLDVPPFVRFLCSSLSRIVGDEYVHWRELQSAKVTAERQQRPKRRWSSLTCRDEGAVLLLVFCFLVG